MPDPNDKKITPGEGGEGTENVLDEKTTKAIEGVVAKSLTPLFDMIKGLKDDKENDKQKKKTEENDGDDDDFDDDEDDDSGKQKTKNKKQTVKRKAKKIDIEKIVSDAVTTAVATVTSTFEKKEKDKYIETLTKEQLKKLKEFPGHESLNLEQIKSVVSTVQLPDIGIGTDSKGKKVNSDNVDKFIDEIRGKK